MEESAYAAELVAAVFFVIAGERLIRLSRHSGEVPERLLGIYLALTGVAYLGWVLPVVVPLGPMAETTDFISWAIYSIGVLPYLLFIRVVFRPTARWSFWVVIGCAGALALSATVLTLKGERYPGLGSTFFWIQWAGYTAPCVWVTIEAALCRRNASRRAKIGLGDPLVTNRYLLLALFGGFQVLACLSDILLAIDFAANQAASASADMLLGAFELAGIAALWLAFFPPVAYVEWVVGSNQPADQVTRG
jgi:hypothetical protein